MRLLRCYDGGRHRWQKRFGRPDEDSYERPMDWCQRCGKWRMFLRDWSKPAPSVKEGGA